MYEDRSTAGGILSEELLDRDLRPDVVLGIPPGGLNVAATIAESFDADLGRIVAEPIRTDATRQLPVGAVTDTGVKCVDQDLVAAFDIDEERLDVEKQRAFREARDKHEMYEGVGSDPTPAGTVLVVDEGIVSDVAMRACVSAIDRVEDCYTAAVAPLGVPEAVADLHAVADEVVVDETIPDTSVVARFYDRFDGSAVPGESVQE